MPASIHFKQPNHNFNTHAKFTFIELIIYTINTGIDTIKIRLKREDFWIVELDTLTLNGLNQELNNF